MYPSRHRDLREQQEVTAAPPAGKGSWHCTGDLGFPASQEGPPRQDLRLLEDHHDGACPKDEPGQNAQSRGRCPNSSSVMGAMSLGWYLFPVGLGKKSFGLAVCFV